MKLRVSVWGVHSTGFVAGGKNDTGVRRTRFNEMSVIHAGLCCSCVWLLCLCTCRSFIYTADNLIQIRSCEMCDSVTRLLKGNGYNCICAKIYRQEWLNVLFS